MTMTTGLPPVPLSCHKCGHSFTTTAKVLSRCPECHVQVKIPAALRRERDRAVVSGRASVPVPAKPQASRQVPAKPQVRDSAGTARQAVRKSEKPHNPRVSAKTLVPEMEVNGIDPADLRYVPEIEWADEPAAESYPDYEDNGYDDGYQRSTDEQIRQARLNAVAQMIHQSRRIHPGPIGAIQAATVPRVLVDDGRTIIGAIARRAATRRGKLADGIQRCAYCGARPGVSTSGLYRVRSPGVEGERILCQMHSQQESMIPGCVVQTL